MRFTTLSLILTLSAIFTATTCHGQDTIPTTEAPAEATDLDHPRIVYSKESKSPSVSPTSSGPAQMQMDTASAAADQATTNTLRRRRHLYDLSRHQKRQHDSAPLQQLVQHRLSNNKRQTPRRLAGEKREGGLLDELVGGKDVAGGQVPPAGTLPAQDPTPSEDGKVQSKSGSINLMERQEAEDESVEEEESEAEEENTDDTEQKSASGLDPLGQTLEDVTNPSPSSSSETDTTESSDESDSSSSSDSSDSATPTTSAEDEQPTPTTEESSSSSEPTETPESQVTVPPPTDPVVSISGDDGSNSDSVDPNAPPKVAPTTSEEPPAADAAQPTTHTANVDAASEANNDGTKTSIMIGVVAAALLVAAALCVWIFRRLKLSPSRQFRGKMGSAGAAGGVHARNNYGPGHDDGSDYNSYDEFYRGPESPLPMMAHAAGPSVIGGMAMSSSCATATDGVGPYPSQNLAHMSMSSESMTDYNQYSYGDGYDMTNALAGSTGLAVLPMVPPSTVGGLPVVGHNIHKYGSEDYSQNTHFLRELRE